MKPILLIILCVGSLNVSLSAQYKFYDEQELGDLSEIVFGQIIDFKIIKDNVFITDFKKAKIYKFSVEGELIRSSGRPGRGPGEFEFGPRYITAVEERLYVTSMMPMVSRYDLDLNFIEYQRLIQFATNIQGLHSKSDNILFVPNIFYEESIFIYSLENQETKSVFLDFEIDPGLLSKYDIYQFGDQWLFAWEFQNRFELYDSSFSKISSFKLPNVPDKAEGKYSDFGVIPKEANNYRAKMYQKGTFFPYGTFFTSFIKLDEEHLLVQLGIQTGGDEKALIIDLQGNIKQEIEFPKKRMIALEYHNNILYMQEQETMSVVAFEFRK